MRAAFLLCLLAILPAVPALADAPADIPAPVAGQTTEWPDADEDAKDTAEGAIKVCESLTFPLTLIPAAGSVISSVVEWGCLIPAALAVDYVGVHHGQRPGFLWQALLALVAAKLARTVVLYTAVAGAIAAGVLYTTVAIVTLTSMNAAYYIPVGITGLLTLGGVTAIGIHQLRKLTDRAVFSAVYFSLTPPATDEEELKRAREEAWLKPPLDPISRAYGLMTVAAAADFERDWTFAIPVAGPLFKASARAEALKADMRRVGRDVLGEAPQSPEAMDTAIDLVTASEGWLEAGSHALLLGGGVIFVAGTVSATMAWYAYQNGEDIKLQASIAGGLGTVGVFVAGGGVVLLALREVPRVLRPIAVPMAFGFLPPEEQDVE